jgi:Zn-dependent protease
VFTLEPSQIILVAIFLLVAFPVHEFAHAYVAWQLGDGTAKMLGRLTLNPVVHFDPFGGLMLIVSALSGSGFIFGWAKPTPVNPANLRDRRNGEVLVSLAGPASNLIMACIGALVVRAVIAMSVDVPVVVGQILIYFVVYNIALMLFNLIPVPPLDGSAIVFRLLSPRAAWQYRAFLAQYGAYLPLVLLIVLLGFGRVFLSDLIFNVSNFLVGG